MKALFFEEHGDLDVIQYGDVPDPIMGPDQVLVKVRACALNHLDIWVRRGWPGLNLEMPHWGAADVAGEIVGTGKDVSSWKIGQAVVLDPGINAFEDEFTRRGEDSLSPGYHILGEQIRGGAAQFIAIPSDNPVALPSGMDYTAAAAPLLVTLTAWRMLINRAKLKEKETVLIVGAGGGVNSMALQIAKFAEATVYVVASTPEKTKRAYELGADVVFDRSEVDWPREVYKHTQKRGVDVVVDNVGSATLQSSMKAAARGGRIVIVGNTSGPQAQIDIRYIFGKQLSLIGSTMGTHQDFRKITSLLWSGKIKPIIDRVIPLSEGKEAYASLERGDHFGKIILTP